MPDLGTKIVMAVLTALVIGPVSLSSADDLQSTAQGPYDSHYAIYPTSAVTTDTDMCAQYGVDVLRSGNGSVVDAAIVTWLCIGIVNMQSCGIGGGYVATIYERPRGESEKELLSLLARERAPLAATQDMFANGSASSTTGGKAVAVPGDVMGHYEAWKKFGRMPWRDLFQNAIQMCEQGYIVEKALSIQIQDHEEFIRADPNFSELLVKEDGTLIQEGDLLINSKLGATLRRIADDPMTYYNGILADDIVADLIEYDGIITKEDLLAYHASLKQTVNVTIQNGRYVLYNPPPPTSGVVINFIINILDGYNFSPVDVVDDPSRILTYHRMVEAYKFAYAKRSDLGDEDFVDVTELVANLTSDRYAEEIRQQIDDDFTHDIDYYGPTFDMKPDAGTSHMNLLAPDGSALALTGTINLYFGSKTRGRRTGIIFNNEMDDFSTPGTYNSFGVPASPTNFIEPGKMPMSSMCPTLVVDETGTVKFLGGGSGGTRITTSTSFTVMQALWFGIDLKNATDHARFHHQLAPNELEYETWMEQVLVDGIAAKNHSMLMTTQGANVGTIHKHCSPDCYLESASDARKGGTPAGF